MGWIEGKLLEKGLEDPRFFRRVVRRLAYLRAGGDPERVHEMALEALNKYVDIASGSHYVLGADLRVNIAGSSIMPFGTAAGLDKNCDALEPLSYMAGFQEVGTIIVNPRKGNDRPRVAVDEKAGDLYNAQGFPSKGLDYAARKLMSYREHGGNAFILASICGLPPGPDSIDVALDETRMLLKGLDLFVDGFVWNPFSPNTAALTLLRKPRVFRQYAQLVKEKAGGRPALVKMGPYEEKDRQQWIDLAGGWMEGGGDGLVGVNTYMVPKESVPSRNWGYPSAGRSGRFLRPYRQRAIRDARREFPDSLIIATGGIDSAEEAWQAFDAGANLLEGYTPYTFHGLGLLPQMTSGVKGILRANRLGLQEYQDSIKSHYS
ncbi:MAG: hypothetical protein HY367_01975 [Candidatus Aenigmarchaeota archaeon]|nr:hypothetical protein [Candidatus Aenigmarchaeota archaeon]